MILVSMDYSDIEGIVAASLAGEENYIQEYNKGISAHDILATKLNISRQKAKIVNHGCRYGMSEYGLSRELNISENEAALLISEYWKNHAKIAEFKNKLVRKARKLRQLKTYYGFEIAIDFTEASDDKIWASFIQGTAADIVKLAMIELDKYLKSNNLGRILINLHDSLVFSLVDEKRIEEIKSILENIDDWITLKVKTKIGEF